MSVELKEKAVALLGSVDSVNLNDAATSQLIYTVPTGKKCVLDHVRIRNLSATAASCTCTVGQSGALTDFLNTQTLSGLNAAAATGILRPVPNAITVKGVEYAASTLLYFDVVVAAGSACTATIEFFGTLDDA
jgi:hypothetical protein